MGFPATYLAALAFQSIRQRDPYPAWQHVTIVAWTGMRESSLWLRRSPCRSRQNGAPFPGRDLIPVPDLHVILATLVLQGLSLPPLIRWLGVEDDRAAEKEDATRGSAK